MIYYLKQNENKLIFEQKILDELDISDGVSILVDDEKQRSV